MMMTSLFSIFDPSSSFFSCYWITVGIAVLFLPSLYWGPVATGVCYEYVCKFIKLELNCAMNSPVKGMYSFICSIFVIISLYNFLALFPHLFSVTSHMLVTLPFSFVFWLSLILFSWVSSLKHFLAHLIPVGTPLALISFMVVVEVLSNFIRPLALTFRLTANMMAGHLLMSLIGTALISSSFLLLLMGCLIQSLLVFMEVGVSLIQAYVFTTLLLLYMSETDK